MDLKLSWWQIIHSDFLWTIGDERVYFCKFRNAYDSSALSFNAKNLKKKLVFPQDLW